MPERQHYAHLFRGNPLRGTAPEEAFSLLNWGNHATRTFTIDAPEPLVMLGMAKMLVLRDRVLTFRRGETFLAVGHKSNELYLIPRVNNRPLERIPPFHRRTAECVGEVLQTDYLSTKGKDRKEHHYYHKHEKPYPRLWLNHAARVGYLHAASHNGKPSYAVGEEGIVG